MANTNPETLNQDFLQQLLDMQTFAAESGAPNLVGTDNIHLSSGDGAPFMLQLNSFPAGLHGPRPVFPLGLSLDQGVNNGGGGSSIATKRFRDDISVNNHNFVDGANNSVPNNVFHGQPMSNPVPMAPQQPVVRPRVRARRGQATDPHSIAERLRRERIAERIRALQELVPSVNKTDRAAMLDEIVDYVKFLRLQVKVLSMSRLGGAGAVVPLVTDMPISSVEDEGGEGGRGQPVWEKWSNDGTEKQVTKLMEENVGAAMQFLQSKALCIMPVSLASAIYQTQPPDAASLVNLDSNPLS